MLLRNKPAVSVIITCYNDWRVFKCLDSIFSAKNSSTKKEVNIILVPNLELENQLKQYRFQANIYHSPKGNLSRSINIGIKNSTYDQVLLLDSDIIVSDNFFEEMLKYSEKYSVVKADIVFSYHNWLTKIISKSRKIGHVGNLYIPGLLIKKNVFQKIGLLNEKVEFGEDNILDYRIKKNGINFIQISSAQIYHPPITVIHDLKMAFKIGRGQRQGVEFEHLDALEDFREVYQRCLTGETFKYFTREAKKNGLAVALYDIFWFMYYYAGYYAEKYFI